MKLQHGTVRPLTRDTWPSAPHVVLFAVSEAHQPPQGLKLSEFC